jgi:hypothetical protein
MSLSDRYNRGEGRIQSFDKYLTDLGNRVGNLWSDQTGVSRRSLTQGLYVLSALAATQHFAVAHDPTVLLFAGIALLAYMGAMPALGGVLEQIQAEAAGLPKNSLAIMRLFVFWVGALLLTSAVARMFGDLLGSAPLDTQFALDLLMGVSLVSLQASEYIRRTNPATPSGGGHGSGGPKRVFLPR